jgi:hypothetical protein
MSATIISATNKPIESVNYTGCLIDEVLTRRIFGYFLYALVKPEYVYL